MLFVLNDAGVPSEAKVVHFSVPEQRERDDDHGDDDEHEDDESGGDGPDRAVPALDSEPGFAFLPGKPRRLGNAPTGTIIGRAGDPRIGTREAMREEVLLAVENRNIPSLFPESAVRAWEG